MLNATQPSAGRNSARMMPRRLSEAARSPTDVAASAEDAATVIAAATPRAAGWPRGVGDVDLMEAMAWSWFLVGSWKDFCQFSEEEESRKRRGKKE